MDEPRSFGCEPFGGVPMLLEPLPAALRSWHRVALLLGLLALAAGSAGLGGRLRPASAQQFVDVKIVDFAYEPASVTVHIGDALTFTHRGGATTRHTVTARDGSFDSGELGAGEGFDLQFDKPGTISFYCTVHPERMQGTITVLPAEGVAVPTAPPATATEPPAATEGPRPTATATWTRQPTATLRPANTPTPGGPATSAGQEATSTPPPKGTVPAGATMAGDSHASATAGSHGTAATAAAPGGSAPGGTALAGDSPEVAGATEKKDGGGRTFPVVLAAAGALAVLAAGGALALRARRSR